MTLNMYFEGLKYNYLQYNAEKSNGILVMENTIVEITLYAILEINSI